MGTGFRPDPSLSDGPKGSLKRMRSTSLTGSRGKGRGLFFAALCMAIVVALFSALAPLGLPSSRLTGSAFNPATTSVILKARSPLVAAGPVLHEPDGDRSKNHFHPVPHSWFSPVTILSPGAPAIVAKRWARQYRSHNRHPALVSDQHARAPPAFF